MVSITSLIKRLRWSVEEKLHSIPAIRDPSSIAIMNSNFFQSSTFFDLVCWRDGVRDRIFNYDFHHYRNVTSNAAISVFITCVQCSKFFSKFNEHNVICFLYSFLYFVWCGCFFFLYIFSILRSRVLNFRMHDSYTSNEWVFREHELLSACVCISNSMLPISQ